MRGVTRTGLIVGVVVLGGCGGLPPITSCEPGSGITPDCRFHNPEDLAPSPDGSRILVSQFGTMDGGEAGSLVAYDPANGEIVPLFPTRDTAFSRPRWGDPDCAPPDPSAFAPHGIDIEALGEGGHALYVVNHGGREAVEMFEVTDAGALTWAGCVEAPEDGYFNDLVVLRDGGFWVSQMFPRGANALWIVLRSLITGYESGYAYAWHADTGFTRIPGSDAQMANGIEKSADERFLFLNSYLGDAVIKIDVERGERLAAADVPSPDNLTWSPTGELLAASHTASLSQLLACQNIEEGSCAFAFEIVAIDPDSLTTRRVLAHEGAPMGAATVALPFEGQLYLGTFAGDRIARADAR